MCACVCVRVCVCFSLSSFSLQRDSALAAYISQSKSPCGRIEQGVPELTSDGHQPGGSRAGGAGGREGPQGRAGRWTLAGTGLLPALPAPSPCGGQSPLGLGLSQFDSLGLGEGLWGRGPAWARPSLPEQLVERGECPAYGEGHKEPLELVSECETVSEWSSLQPTRRPHAPLTS